MAGVLLAAWLAGRAPDPGLHNPPADKPAVSKPAAVTPLPRPRTNFSAIHRPVRTNARPVVQRPVVISSTTLTNSVGGTNWEDTLDEILVSDSDDTNKVKELFAMFPRLPEDGQVEVAQHLSNLVEDEDYGPLGQLLKDARLPEASVTSCLPAVRLGRIVVAIAGALVAAAFAKGQQVSLQRLRGSFTALNTEQARVAYGESLAAVDYIRSRYSMAAVQQILKTIAAGSSAEEALQSVISLNYEQLEKNLGAYVSETYGK